MCHVVTALTSYVSLKGRGPDGRGGCDMAGIGVRKSAGRARLVTAAACTLALTAACGGGSSGGAQPSRSSTPAASASVTSSIATGSVLEQPVQWTAAVSSVHGVVAHVDFVIDGTVRWREQQEPYQFNDDGRVFAPWPLGAGSHQLAVRVVDPNGRPIGSAVAAVTVKPSAHSGPPVGTYRRTVTTADQTRSQPYRDAEHGASGEVTPTGPWSLQVQADGVVVLDQVPHPAQFDPLFEPFTGSGHRFTLYGPAQWLQPHPDRDNNFCDPEAASTYSWSLSGTALTITQLQKACADRDTVVVGTWHRV